FHAGCSMPPCEICPGTVIWLLGNVLGGPFGNKSVAGVCPLAVWKRFPNAGVSALLAARTKPPFAGEKAISSTRVAPPVEIVCTGAPGLAGLVNWKTLSVLLPSPA